MLASIGAMQRSMRSVCSTAGARVVSPVSNVAQQVLKHELERQHQLDYPDNLEPESGSGVTMWSLGLPTFPRERPAKGD